MFSVTKRGNTLEIMMYAAIGEAHGGVPSSEVVKGLKDHSSATAIDVRINSPGGCVFEGLAIYGALRRDKRPVTVHVDALAASIASVIAMAGNKILIDANATVMVHNPWTLAMGDSRELRKAADTLDRLALQLLDIYAARTGRSSHDLRANMDDETWYSASEAVQAGFADVVVGGKKVTPTRAAAKGREPDWKVESEANDRRLKLLRLSTASIAAGVR